MARVQTAREEAPRVPRNRHNLPKQRRPISIKESGTPEIPGLRERKKVRLRQEIIKTAVKLFRKHGYEKHPRR